MDSQTVTDVKKQVPFSIGKKIALSFSVILIIFIALGFIIITNVRSMNREGSYQVKYGGLQAFLSAKLGDRTLDSETGRFQRKLNQNIDVVEDVVTKRKEDALRTEVKTRETIIFLIFISFIVSIIAGTLLIRGIIAPLRKTMMTVQLISHGNFDARIEVSTKDEFFLLAEGINHMASELKKSRQALEEQMEFIRQLSLTDPLTGLYNRRGFVSLMDHQVDVAVRNKKKIVIIYADMDNLKVLNDSHGHEYGDRAIVKIADFLKDAFRRSDIVSRVGGDEFAIALTDSKEGEAESIRQRLIERIASYNLEQKDPYPIGLSIGIVNAEPNEAKEIDKLLSQADQLMYEEKKLKKIGRAAKS
ncbi:MAG: hypothetical protein AUJ72_00800 [Candidatus Omnitrophica bacterium CG1_02_46_14]|nr:MAG: hypothetical protein AUJ72_00800 [Candidatus Omnitrophica bacterium CG1_02_46_14]